MRTALLELRRQPRRFVTAIVVLTLLAQLLLFLGGLLDGLVAGSVGAIRAQRGDLVVYSESARESLLRSRVTADERAAIEDVDGVERTGGLGVVQLGARVPGGDERDLAGVALFGYEIPPEGVPEPPAAGQAWADSTLEADGVEEGDVVRLGPARSEVEVVGFVDDTAYSGQASLWAAPETWREVQAANRPDAVVADGAFPALVVVVDDGADATAVADRIDEATGTTSSLTVAAAADSVAGVRQQRATFNQILGVTLLVAVVVVALFFALLTVERTALYGVLKALGATSARVFAGVLVQALVVTAVAAAVASALALALDLALPPGSVPYDLSPGRVAGSVAALLIAAAVGCAFSLRRVLRIDPASAIGSAA